MIRLAVIALFVLDAGVANARSAPPPQLFGKSIVVSWSETRSQRHLGDREWSNVSANHILSIYVSSAGRAFVRQLNTTRSGSGATDHVAGKGSGPYPVRVPIFSGQMLTVVGTTRGGARRTVVEFDATYSSCSARSGTGFQHGRTSVSFSPITKAYVEMRSVSVGNVTCSIQSGNVFSN